MQMLQSDWLSYRAVLGTHIFSKCQTLASLSKGDRVLEQFNVRFLSKVHTCFSEQFQVLAKGSIKFDCPIKEILFIRKIKPSLNVLLFR